MSDNSATNENNIYGEAIAEKPPTPEITRARREKTAEMLRDRKSHKLSTRVNTDSQMLNCAREDLQLKRKLIEKLDDNDKDLKECLAKVNKTMEAIGNTMKQSVELLGEFMRPRYYPQPNFQMPQQQHQLYRLEQQQQNVQGLDSQTSNNTGFL